MNSSIEIIDEFILNRPRPTVKGQSSLGLNERPAPNLHGSQDIEVISEMTVGLANGRPTRKRKAVKNFCDEQDEDFNKRKRQRVTPKTVRPKKTSQRKSVIGLILQKNLNRTRSKVSKPTSKQVHNDIQVIGEVKSGRVARPEAGGAGAMSARLRKNVSGKDGDIEIVFEWDPAEVISERQGVEEWQARSILKLFDQDNTLPFIARYRKEQTGNLEVEKIREIQNTYSQIKSVREKVAKVLIDDSTNAVSRVTSERKNALLRATTVQEVELLTASLKVAGKKSYADRARSLGLGPEAESILEGKTLKYTCRDAFAMLQNMNQEGLQDTEQIEQGIMHIVADIISKNPQVLEFVRKLMRTSKPMVESKKKKILTKSKKSEGKKVCSTKAANLGPNQLICDKYKDYFDYVHPAWSLRPHQVLAINRGESQSVLKVKVIINEEAHRRFHTFCAQKWLGLRDDKHFQYYLIQRSIDDSWERLVKPFMERHVRSQLTEMAEIASIDVFTANLKKLLLSPPLRGKTILAIDPGFKNGCKIGVTNAQGEVQLTTTIYPFRDKKPATPWSKDHNEVTLREIVSKYGCEFIAIGNGTACRQMEEYLSRLVNSGSFENKFNVRYTIINESGASQYSVSPEARSEFPTMDPNHISAVSLARRLQDPLLEYVKVHPKHLGVGMYQHDIPEKLLNASLDSIMVECVSFVGVDINVASEFVLRKLSGLSKTRAANIVEHRKTKGPFVNREQLKTVKGIGPRTYEQCAGFIKIMPATLENEIIKTPQAKKKNICDSVNPLDRTLIHPESYVAAKTLMDLVSVRAQDIGTENFIKKVRNFSQNSSLDFMSDQCKVSSHTVQLLLEGLTRPLDFDLRSQFDKPLFRSGLTSINDLKIGTRLTGTVRNMTHFGAFVDVGVGSDGLIHTSNMNGLRIELGTNVEVTVRTLEVSRQRIGLFLEKLI